MHLWIALLIWVIIVVVTYIIAKKSYIYSWESFVLAILFGYLFLLIFSPWKEVYDRNNPWLIIYIGISVISPIILAVYVVKTTIVHKSKTNNLFR